VVRAEPQQILVALDGSGQYRSIQEAVDAARKGDTIFVKPGVYAEDVTIHSTNSTAGTRNVAHSRPRIELTAVSYVSARVD